MAPCYTSAALALWHLLKFYEVKITLIWDLCYPLVMLPDDIKISHDFYMMSDTISSWDAATPDDKVVTPSSIKIKIGFDVVGELLRPVDETCSSAENIEQKASNS